MSSTADPAPTRASPLPTLLTLLVVDDDDFLRETLGSMLRHAGYAVVLAANAEDAWARFQSAPDLFAGLVSDIVMPGQRGDALAAQILTQRSDLPVVLITGHPLETVSVPPGAKPNQIWVLRKPFRIGDLLKVLPAPQEQSAITHG
jgi:CheY-like chemotaxis protein